VFYLKFRRIELDLTCRAVAEQVGVSNGWYGQIERGRINPTTDELKRIGKALKCAPDRLLTHVSCATRVRWWSRMRRVPETTSVRPADVPPPMSMTDALKERQK
jgi:transcriptional regulator with XRE-family HTH domain